jgi:molybdate transport system regulatory protein
MHVNVKITVGDREGRFFMGSGLVCLLEGIERHRSIRAAAHEMDLSYPKALRMIKNVEGGLGCPIVLRRKGGSERGGAELTPIGQEFLRRYERVQQRIQRFAENAFQKAFERPLLDGLSR